MAITPAPVRIDHDFGPGFDRAVQTAVEHIDVTKRIVREDFWVGFAIVRKTSPSTHEVSYHCFNADAWEKPQTHGLLPWSAPTGEVVAHVSMDAEVNLTSNPRG